MIINNYYVEEINNVQKYKLPYELSLGLVIYDRISKIYCYIKHTCESNVEIIFFKLEMK